VKALIDNTAKFFNSGRVTNKLDGDGGGNFFLEGNVVEIDVKNAARNRVDSGASN